MPEFSRETGQELIDHEGEFEKAVERVDIISQQTPKFRAIVAEAEDSGDFEGANKKLKAFLLARREALDKTVVKGIEGFKIDEEGLRRDIDNFDYAQSDQERLLGNGAVAEVFRLRGLYKTDCCVKIVLNENMYAQGNTIEKEHNFLEKLQDVNVGGVRTPKPFYSFSNLRMKGLVMEELDAFNFRRILDGFTTGGIKDQLPYNFDVDGFFSKLKEYLQHLHSLGVYHCDIALRNLMVNRKTGLPMVIDFGKARLASDLDKTNLNMPDYAKSDLASLDSAKAEVKEWLRGRAKKSEESQ